MRLAHKQQGEAMSRIINPLLLDASTTASALPRQSFARTAEVAKGPTFAQQLSAIQAPGATAAAPAAQATQTPAAVAPVSSADDSDPVSPSSSSRVDRSAAEVNQDVDDFGLKDFWDIINPLQHIPIVSTIYREMSGDTIKPVSRVAGDVLFGAATGSLLLSGILSVAGAAYEQQTGQEPVMQVADALFGIKKTNPDSTTMLADAGKTTDPAAASSGAAETTKLAAADTALLAPAPSPAPAPAPVQVASLDEVKTSEKTATPTATPVTTPPAKQPYGGVMDMATMHPNQPATAVASASASASPTHVQGMRIGNTIYTNPLMNNAARVTALRAAKAAPAASTDSTPAAAPPAATSSTPASSPASATAPLAALSIPGSTPTDSKTLGKMMQDSAMASSSGQTLPPNLVQDMMLMALDKYKTAGGLSPSEMSVGMP